MVSQKLLRKSSANYLVRVEFSQKGFDISIFGHFFCPFSQNFFDSCANRIEKITKLFYKFCYKKREHNGHMFLMGAKSHFLAPKKT